MEKFFIIMMCILACIVAPFSMFPMHHCTALADDEFPLAEPVTLTAWAVNTVSQYTLQENYITQWIHENTNVDFQITREFTGADAKERMQWALATEPLPDVLLCTGWSKAECALYSSQGLVIPIDQWLEQCPNWQRMNEICSSNHERDLYMPDGHIYCYGSVNECFHLTHQARMWVYQPWIDLLCDGKLPETTEEFRLYLEKVADMDPNGNGISDEIPLSGEIDRGFATDPFTFISNAFVHNNTIYGSTNPIVAPGCYVREDLVQCNWVEDGYREALRYMRSLFVDGLLYGQTYTQNWMQLKKLMEAKPNRLGAVACGVIPAHSDTILENGRWSEWTCLPPLAGPEGVRLSYQSAYNYFYNCNGLVTKACKNPELAVRLFDFLASEEGTLVQNFGKEGVNWRYCQPDEGVGFNGEPAKYRLIYDNYAQAILQENCLWPSDVTICSLTEDIRTGMMVDEEALNYEQYLWNCAEIYSRFSPGSDTVYPNIAYTPEQSLKLMQFENTIGNYVKESTVRFILGELDPDKDWKTYLDNLESYNQSGYQQLLQEAYNSWKQL